MRYAKLLIPVMGLLLMMAGCSNEPKTPAVEIVLSDQIIQVDGIPAGNDPEKPVYIANDIVYYESGKDFTYGEGTQQDAHSAQDAAAHTVVHIAKPGTYRISGVLSKGQIAVDLGEDAKNSPNAVVTLILNGADITCEVAPAVIFYRVYECGDSDNASKDVDTSAAGANVIIADGSENTIRGSYVARIYKPDSVVLSEDGMQVEEAKKLHKYDGAFYSKMSMNISGDAKGNGLLKIYAENEGLDSEMHLTLNGGNIDIYSGNDGINTNEDGVSVTTVNDGVLNIRVTGETGEGDGIDSNGWLVINGGTVIAAACSDSADAGIDSDMGIHINGGKVVASGHMLDRIEDGGQTYAVFTFNQEQNGKQTVELKTENGKTVEEICPGNGYSILIYSSANLKAGTYTLWSDGQQLAGQSDGAPIGPGMSGMRPEGPVNGMQPPEGEAPGGGKNPPDGGFPPEEQQPPDGWNPPEAQIPPEKPDKPIGGNWNPSQNIGAGKERSPDFVITKGGNMFSGISPL